MNSWLQVTRQKVSCTWVELCKLLVKNFYTHSTKHWSPLYKECYDKKLTDVHVHLQLNDHTSHTTLVSHVTLTSPKEL